MRPPLISLSVGQIAARVPKSVTLFREKQIDFYCGGATKLAVYLPTHPELLTEIGELLTSGSETDSWLKLQTADIIDRIQHQFHDVHRQEFPELLRLAKKVTKSHAHHPHVPRGLPDFLEFLQEDLEAHMLKEEELLFPWILADPQARPLMPLQILSYEHTQQRKSLQELAKRTHQYLLPIDTGAAWKKLYRLLAKFRDDLQEHIHIENNILFPHIVERS